MNSSLIKPRWLLWPFAEQIVGIAMFGSIAPACYSLWLVSEHRWVLGILILIAWLFAFVGLSFLLERNRIVRLWISWPSAILALVLFWFVVLSKP